VKVYIKTPARLQMGLIDLNGDLGRIFGGLGAGVDHPNVILEATQSRELSVIGEKPDLVKALAKQFLETYHVNTNVSLQVYQTIPEHVGLGSGTQLALAVAVALARLFNVKATTQELAIVMGRGQRTSVGTTVFDKGGFVLDGGKMLKNKAAVSKFPPLIFHKSLPENWCFIIAIPNGDKGLYSDAEKAAFKQLSPMPVEDVGRVCRLTMMKLLPSLIEHDIENFGEALTSIQVIIGDYFAKVQGGRYSSSVAADCIMYMQQIGAYGVGQSSWGPTCYGLFKEADAKGARDKVQSFLRDSSGGQAFTAYANNKGAYIKLT
jgi:beta-ribofuranosylaminobenzene 5'-phosphate synthase